MRSRRAVGRYALAILVSLSALPVGGDECSQANSNGVSSGDELNISGVSSSEINTAIGYWSDGCSGYGSSFPSMSAGGSGGVSGSVTFHPGTSTLASGSCGRTTFTLQAPGNKVVGADIEIWERQGNGVDCIHSDTLAHELGHVLGLADNYSSACIGRIMGGRPSGGTRSVGSSDCVVAGQRWSTPAEQGGGAGGAGCPPI